MIVCLSISFADSEDTKEIEQNQEIQSQHEKESLSQQGDNQNQDVVNNESTESDSKNGETKSDESVKSSANSIAKNTSQAPSVNPLDTFEIIRLGGSDRYATSMRVADEFKKNLGVDKLNCIILTYGGGFADAMSASYLGKANNAPILLTENDNIYLTLEYIKKNLAANGKIYIIGGQGVLSNKFEALLKDYDVTRLSGNTRYETNMEILKAVEKPNELAICSGNAFPDSLSVSSTGKAIMLVDNMLLDYQKQFIKDITSIYIIGGTKVVSSAIEDAAKINSNCERIYGGDRFETSYAVARRFFPN